MLNIAGLLYLGSRAASAAGNLLAVMIFTRLAGPAEYGHYVLIYTWSLIAYGFGAQWVHIAYFGVYHPQRAGEYAASLARMLGCGLGLVALVMTSLGIFGFYEPSFLVAIFALVCGITVYQAAFEVARTMLSARAAALSMFMRAALAVTLGSTSLWLGGGARGLAFAIAVAHVFAAIPSLATFSKFRLSQGSWAASQQILRYGWPLFLSVGINVAGQSIDRLLLAHYVGPATLGPYGVVADMLRQTFTVFGDAITLSLVTMAKQRANEDNLKAANALLQKAFNACLAVASFGAAFFIVFGDLVLRALLKPEFVAPTHGLIPIFAVAFAFIAMRNYYFAQVIYFTRASYLELVVSVLFLLASTAVSMLLIPSYGAWGAAVALLSASILSCLAFMALGRRWYRLHVDIVGVAIIPSLAAIFVFAAHAMAEFVPQGPAPLVLDAIVFALFGSFALRNFGLLNAIPTGALPEQISVR